MGPKSEFFPLKDQCFEYSEREYTYKFCPFDSASQRSKNGGGDTRLGYVLSVSCVLNMCCTSAIVTQLGYALNVSCMLNMYGTCAVDVPVVCGMFRYWGSWAGRDDDRYSVMLMDRGQGCWNGPERSVKVRLVSTSLGVKNCVQQLFNKVFFADSPGVILQLPNASALCRFTFTAARPMS